MTKNMAMGITHKTLTEDTHFWISRAVHKSMTSLVRLAGHWRAIGWGHQDMSMARSAENLAG